MIDEKKWAIVGNSSHLVRIMNGSLMVSADKRFDENKEVMTTIVAARNVQFSQGIANNKWMKIINFLLKILFRKVRISCEAISKIQIGI